jgi:hypothetical protein
VVQELAFTDDEHMIAIVAQESHRVHLDESSPRHSLPENSNTQIKGVSHAHNLARVVSESRRWACEIISMGRTMNLLAAKVVWLRYKEERGVKLLGCSVCLDAAMAGVIKMRGRQALGRFELELLSSVQACSLQRHVVNGRGDHATALANWRTQNLPAQVQAAKGHDPQEPQDPIRKADENLLLMAYTCLKHNLAAESFAAVMKSSYAGGLCFVLLRVALIGEFREVARGY